MIHTDSQTTEAQKVLEKDNCNHVQLLSTQKTFRDGTDQSCAIAMFR